MTSPLYPTFHKRINDATEQIIKRQVTPWSFLTTGHPFRVKMFDGQQISYEGIGFEGSPRTVFWSRYIEPFLEDLCVSEIGAAVTLAKEKGVDGRQLLPELQALLSAGCRRIYTSMADVDRRLRGRGYPDKVALKSIESEVTGMTQFIEERVRAELEMWSTRAMTIIPVAFLSHASRIFTETAQGLSGSRIVEFCNAYATDHGVDTPHATYPFKAPNKRTALLDNLRAFPAEAQYEMLLDLCDLAGKDRSEVQDIRTKLIDRFKGELGASARAAQVSSTSSVLRFLGVSGAADYRNPVSATPLSKPLVFLCHASEDKPVTRHLYKQLLGDEYNPWLDEEMLLPGQEWQIEIPRAVRRADAVLVCLSQRSIDKAGYVQREIRIALDAAEERPDGEIYIMNRPGF